jgi:hypothetical protein
MYKKNAVTFILDNKRTQPSRMVKIVNGFAGGESVLDYHIAINIFRLFGLRVSMPTTTKFA